MINTRFQSFREYAENQVVLANGAMATLLHQQGLPVRTCFEELCVSHPALVRRVHQAYVSAGATLIQTNTFSGHKAGLSRYGLESSVEEINRAAVRVARDAVNGQAYVFGTIGSTADLGLPIGITQDVRRSLDALFDEQLSALLSETVDGILLETFADLEEMMIAIEVVRRSTDLPIIANLSPDAIGVTRDGHPLATAFATMLAAGADVVGLNCRLGPSGILRSYEQMELSTDALYSAVPNAGMLHLDEGDYAYTGNAEYFTQTAVKLVEQGVSVIGGCCGTTPEHILQLSSRIRAMETSGSIRKREHDQIAKTSPSAAMPVTTIRTGAGLPLKPDSLVAKVQTEVTVIVELDPPRTLDVGRYLEGARALKQAGVDAITMADNSLGMVRVSNMAIAALLKQMNIEPLVHVTCRDRNLIGQQSHLMGLNVLGVHHILLVTGDPSRFGDLPGASSVYDVSSIELTRMVKRLNNGTSFSGQAMKQPSSFVIGTSFNPHVLHFDKAIDRLRRKLDAGADYVMTQPIFDPRIFERVARAVEPFDVPVFAGIMPLTSYRNAQFLHNEVPGIDIPQSLIAQMDRAEPSLAIEQGLSIAETLVDEALQYFNGIYLVTPFLKYDLTVHLARVIQSRKKVTVR
jgi:methionine synthase I (cobalamin-dependent)/5,10-methylenetetrahydrofolate reductase